MNKQELAKKYNKLSIKMGLKGLDALKAVKRNGFNLRYVLPKDQTSEICLEAVKEDGYALDYVCTQTEEICLAAVKQYGLALQYVDIQTPEMCLIAVKENGHALQYINPEIIEQWRKEPSCLGKIIEVDGVKYKLGEV